MESSLKKLKTDIAPNQSNNWETTKLHPLLIDQVLNTVFSELSVSCLKEARKVCKFWNTRAVDEIAKRDTKIIIDNNFYAKKFLNCFDNSQDKGLFTKKGTFEFKSIPVISYFTSKGFLSNEDIAIKNMVFNFHPPSSNQDNLYFALKPDIIPTMDFDQFFNQLSKCSKQLKSLTFSAPSGFHGYLDSEIYYKLFGKNESQVNLEIKETVKKWSPCVQMPNLESLTISCGFSWIFLLNNPSFFINLIGQRPPKLSTLDLGFKEFPSLSPDMICNRILLPIGPQLTNLSITIFKQTIPGFAQALCDLAQGGMQLKKLSLSVLYEFDGQDASDNVVFPPDGDEALVDAALELANELEEVQRRALIIQEIMLFNAFFKSQKDSIEELKINLKRSDFCFETEDEKIILPVFSEVTSLDLYHRNDDYEDYDGRENYENLLSKMSLTEKFPKLEKISLDSKTIGYDLINRSTPYGFMKTLEYTFTKQEIFPSNFLRAAFSRVETLVIKYPLSSKCIYYIHPNVNGSHIPWKNSLENLEINYPLYDLERFDFASLRLLAALKKLKFICIPTDIVSFQKPYRPNLTPLRALSLTSIIFQNYKIPRDHESEISRILPHFQSL